MASKGASAATGALSGAGSGALIGSAIPGIGTAIGAGIGAIGGGIAGLFGGGDDDTQKYLDQQNALREQTKQNQLGYLGQLQAPTVSDATRRRITALEDESKPTSLVEDPYFQGQRATLVQGGQQALSSTDNAHAAYGTTGGFSNQGSAADIYDRLGGQLAQLGGQSAQLKDQKANQAAQMQQQIQDSQTAFQNAQIQAKIAIESGDSASASAAIQAAMQAKAAYNAANQQMLSAGLGGVAQAAGAYAGANKFTATAPPPGQPAGGFVGSDQTWAAMKGKMA